MSDRREESNRLRTELAAVDRLIVRHPPLQHAHPVASRYVEVFYTPVLGPSALLMLRRFSYAADGRVFSWELLSRSLGLSRPGQTTFGKDHPVIRTAARLVLFRVAEWIDYELWASTTVPTLSPLRLARLPEELQHAHRLWLEREARHA